MLRQGYIKDEEIERRKWVRILEIKCWNEEILRIT